MYELVCLLLVQCGQKKHMTALLKKAHFKTVNLVVQLTEQPKSMLAIKKIVNVAESGF